MAKGKFQNLTIDYRDLLKMTVTDRASILRSSLGDSLLASLTPQQMSSLFPTYYKERMPDISGFEKAMTPEGMRRVAAEGQNVTEGTYSRPGGTAEKTALQRATPASVDRLMKKTGVNITDPGAKIRLSDEKTKLLNELKKSNIPADDPRVSFLKEIKPEELKKYGIESVKSGEKEEYKYVPVQVTPEEIDKARKSTITGKSNQEIIMKSFADELRKKGVPAENIPYAVAALAGQVQAESRFNPKAVHDANTGYGIYGARDERPGVGRKTNMLKWMEQNGFDKDSPEGQARYMVHEAFTKYPKTKSALIAANKDNMLEVSGVLVKDFERPKEQHQNTISRAQNSQGFIDTATRIANAPNIPDTASDEQIAATLAAQKEEERKTALAERTEVPKAPEGLNQNLVEYFNKLSPAQKQRFVEALNKEGAGTDNPTATGVAKLNELSNMNPQGVEGVIAAGLASTPSSRVTFSDKSVQARAELLNTPTKTAYEKFKVFAPERTVTSSTFRDVTHPIEAAKGAGGPHTRGQAVDISTNNKTKQELAETIQALKKSGFNYVLLEGNPPHIHAEVRPGVNEFTVNNLGAGHPAIDIKTAREAASATEFNVALNEDQQKKTQENAALEQVQAEQRPVQERGLAAYAGRNLGVERAPLFPQTDAQRASVIDQARAEEEAAKPQQAPQVQREPLFVQPTWSQAASAQQPQVRAFADGGEMNVNDGEISAQPINAIKGDNSVVVDSNKNPLFTMNTKEESAKYDPETGKVSVEPVSKNNPDSLKGEDKPAEDQGAKPPTASERKDENTNRMASVASEAASSPNYSMEQATQLTVNPIHSASFGRAMAAARMMKSTDGLGGHFDGGAANLA